MKRNLFLINGTTYVWARSEKVAEKVYNEERSVEAVTVELIPNDATVYIQQESEGAEKAWWLSRLDGYIQLDQYTVAEAFDGCDYDMVPHVMGDLFLKITQESVINGDYLKIENYKGQWRAIDMIAFHGMQYFC